MQRDDAVSEDRRDTGQLDDIGDGDAGVADRRPPFRRSTQIDQPRSLSPLANSTMPDLSYTESRAVGTPRP